MTLLLTFVETTRVQPQYVRHYRDDLLAPRERTVAFFTYLSLRDALAHLLNYEHAFKQKSQLSLSFRLVGYAETQDPGKDIVNRSHELSFIEDLPVPTNEVTTIRK